MEYHEWSTGRVYVDEGPNKGQRMRARLLNDGFHIAFVDMSRRIDGIIHGQFGRLRDQGTKDLERTVMIAYDHGFHMHPQNDDERNILKEMEG